MKHPFILLACLLFAVPLAPAATSPRPNVVIILTDDQGFGELGATGNPLVRTPHIDRFAAQAASLTNFHMMPVCSPTRACLMTGRYNYRTGVVDTFLGRSLMHPDETTLAEMLAAVGARSMCAAMRSTFVPALSCAGQRRKQNWRMPPSYGVPFQPRRPAL